MKLSGGAGFAVGCVFSLTVAGGTVAYAANGGALTLGKANKATATTSLANSAGTALSLSSKAGTPALKVGNGVKVPNLNADKIDGLDSSVFAKASGSTGYVTAAGQSVDVNNDNVPDVIFAG